MMKTNASDGYVSIEVSPYLAHETEKTITQAKVLWARVNRPNLMIKIPATPEGIPAIRKTIASGINVNVTLIFSLARYDEVMDAYLSGLEDRLAEGEPIDHIASVASFFISRVDSKVDALLPKTSFPAGARLRLPMRGWRMKPSPKNSQRSAGKTSTRKAHACSVPCGPLPAPKTRSTLIPPM